MGSFHGFLEGCSLQAGPNGRTRSILLGVSLGVLKSFIRFRVPGGFATGFFVRLRKCVGFYWHVFNGGFLQFCGKCMRRVSKGVYYEGSRDFGLYGGRG